MPRQPHDTTRNVEVLHAWRSFEPGVMTAQRKHADACITSSGSAISAHSRLPAAATWSPQARETARTIDSPRPRTSFGRAIRCFGRPGASSNTTTRRWSRCSCRVMPIAAHPARTALVTNSLTTTTVSSIGPSAAGPDSSERRLSATNRRARDGAEPSQRRSQTSKSRHITSAVRSIATTMTSLPVNTKIHTADHADNL